MKNKVLDLRTERGLRVYAEIEKFYPYLTCVNGAEVFYSEGYTHLITFEGNVIKL